jgi:Mg2+/Co2+ transporter CorB
MKMVPLVSALARLLTPLTATITFISNGLLAIFGLRQEEDKNVRFDILLIIDADNA